MNERWNSADTDGRLEYLRNGIDHTLDTVVGVRKDTEKLLEGQRQILEEQFEQKVMLNSHKHHLKSIDRELKTINGRLDGMDGRLDGIDQRLDKHDQRFDRVEQKLDDHDERFDRVDGKLEEILDLLKSSNS